MDRAAKGADEFVAEAQEIADGLARELVQLGQGDGAGGPDADQLNRLFRAAHSLKGLAAMCDAAAVGELANAIEDGLDDLRLGRAVVSEPLLDALLGAADGCAQLVAARARGGVRAAGPEEVDGEEQRLVAALIAELDARRKEPAGPTPTSGRALFEAAGLDPSLRNVLTEFEGHRLADGLRRGLGVVRVRAGFDLAGFDTGLEELRRRLDGLGEVVSAVPCAEASPPGGIGFDLVVATGAGLERIARALEGLGAGLRLLRPASQAAAAGSEAAGAVAAGSGASSEVREAAGAPSPERVPRGMSPTVRVGIEKLDRLIAAVGELSMARAGLARLAERMRTGALEDCRRAGAELEREVGGLERKLDDLQRGILEVRMVPLEQVFEKLGRMVRKLAHDAGKEIEFSVSGGEVELDKLIVEELADPLMHMLRNAIDHGVEPPASRERAGKPRRGCIHLAARQHGNHVTIEVTDDGRGLDEQAIRAVAVERGLTDAAGAPGLNQRELVNLIFQPGFSTARPGSRLSGRGVGLDVVRTNLGRLSGVIDVQSRRGEGASFRITLPITLAVLRALLVEAGGQGYALPLNAVLEMAPLDAAAIRPEDGREFVEMGGATLPVVRLARVFGGASESAESAPAAPKADAATCFVVVVGLAQQRLGLVVDQLLGTQDVVVKPLGALQPRVRGVAGAADLGGERVLLVLEVAGLADAVGLSERCRAAS